MVNILYQFIEGQTHYGMLKNVLKRVWPLMNLMKYVALHSN